MDKNQTIRKDIVEAWERYVNKSNTRNDLALILDSVMDDVHHQEFDEVFDRVVWDKAMNGLPPTPEDRKEAYRKEAARLLAEYENRQKMQIIQAPSRNGTVRLRKIWYAAAAAVLLSGMLIPAAYLYRKPKTEQMVQYVEVVTRRGEIRTVFLPDYTEVMLNAESRLTYPAVFTGERSVELQGEALFNVTSDVDRPFTVATTDMKVRVLGTVFDVKAYPGDDISLVSVVSGKVEVNLPGGKALLEQNCQVKMDRTTGGFEKVTIDAGKYLSWKNGALYFYRTPVREVVNILNRQYPQADIELAEGDYSFLISAEYENGYTVEVILKSIVNVTGLKCRKTGNKYTLYNEQ